MHTIGIMQGRLSPAVGGRIQAFPVRTWRQEFARAAEAGLDCIEWVYEEESETQNPLRTDEGIREIRQLAGWHGIGVWSVCADFYMTRPLVDSDGRPASGPVKHLVNLMPRVATLGARYIVLPFVDESSLKYRGGVPALERVLQHVIPVAEETLIELHLETDLEPAHLAALLRRVDSSRVRANFDMGNSASLGHDPNQEIELIGPWLGSVHVKDRLLGGGTVPLGRGAVDFGASFKMVIKSGFQGSFILQAARTEDISEVELARRNRDFVLKQIAAVVGG